MLSDLYNCHRQMTRRLTSAMDDSQKPSVKGASVVGRNVSCQRVAGRDDKAGLVSDRRWKFPLPARALVWQCVKATSTLQTYVLQTQTMMCICRTSARGCLGLAFKLCERES